MRRGGGSCIFSGYINSSPNGLANNRKASKMNSSSNVLALVSKLAKAGSSLTVHAARGKKLEGNFRSAYMASRFDALRAQAITAACWESYCHAAGVAVEFTGADFFVA